MISVLEKIKKLSIKERKNIMARAVKLSEECGEVAEAVLAKHEPSASYKSLEKDAILEETCDVILVALSIAYGSGYTTEDIEKILEQKNNKWEKHQK